MRDMLWFYVIYSLSIIMLIISANYWGPWGTATVGLFSTLFAWCFAYWRGTNR